MVVPSELKAWAKVRRLCAVCGVPSMRDQRIGHHLDGGDARGQHEQRQQEQSEQADEEAGMKNRQPAVIDQKPDDGGAHIADAPTSAAAGIEMMK